MGNNCDPLNSILGNFLESHMEKLSEMGNSWKMETITSFFTNLGNHWTSVFPTTWDISGIMQGKLHCRSQKGHLLG